MTTTTTDKLDQYRYVYGLHGDIREHTHEGVAVRWISVELPSGESVRRAEMLADYRARALADAVVDGTITERRWCQDDYVAAKKEAARINNLWERTWRSSSRPGAFVMRGEWTRA